MTKLNLILDTNIYFSAFVFDKRILRLVDYCFETHQIYTSFEILDEIQNVLFRKKTQTIIKNFDLGVTQKFISKITDESLIKKPTKEVFLCRDPKDNKFLELAQEVQANYIITGDLDLLDLKQFESCKIITPVEFIKILDLEL